MTELWTNMPEENRIGKDMQNLLLWLQFPENLISFDYNDKRLSVGAYLLTKKTSQFKKEREKVKIRKKTRY